MIFPAATVAVLMCLLALRSRDPHRSPMMLALAAWGLSLLCAAPILFTFDVDYSLATDLFVAACLVSSTGAYVIVRRPVRAEPPEYPSRAKESLVVSWLGWAGLLGCVLLLIDARANSGLEFSLGYLFDNISTIRDTNFDGLASGVNRGLYGTVGGFLAPLVVLNVLGTARLGLAARRSQVLLAALNLVLVAAVSLAVFAGRATIVNLVLLLMISSFLSGKRISILNGRTIIVGLLVVAGAWYLATAFFGTREDNTRPLSTLEETQRAKPRPWLAGAIADNESAGLAVVNIGYFGSPLPTLTFYMEQQATPGPYYGQYSFPLPARVVKTLLGNWDRGDWYSIRQAVYAPIESRNYFGNVWATWLRDLLIDFGAVVAILFCAAAGAFMAWARNRHEMTGALHYHYFEVLACFSLGFGAFTSFLFDPFLAIPFFMAFVVMAFVRLSWPAGRQARLRAAPSGASREPAKT